eukprot:12986-Pelagococcus_subviridis.AAC.2
MAGLQRRVARRGVGAPVGRRGRDLAARGVPLEGAHGEKLAVADDEGRRRERDQGVRGGWDLSAGELAESDRSGSHHDDPRRRRGGGDGDARGRTKGGGERGLERVRGRRGVRY